MKDSEVKILEVGTVYNVNGEPIDLRAFPPRLMLEVLRLQSVTIHSREKAQEVLNLVDRLESVWMMADNKLKEPFNEAEKPLWLKNLKEKTGDNYKIGMDPTPEFKPEPVATPKTLVTGKGYFFVDGVKHTGLVAEDDEKKKVYFVEVEGEGTFEVPHSKFTFE